MEGYAIFKALCKIKIWIPCYKIKNCKNLKNRIWDPMWLQVSQVDETSPGWTEQPGEAIKADHRALKAQDFALLDLFLQGHSAG